MARIRSLAFTVLAALLALSACAVHPGKVPDIVSARDTAPKTVQTADGALAGGATLAGQAFLGVPFAAPPVGPNRWRPPQPVKPWKGVRDATHIQSACPQSPGFGLVLGDEDCLYLNVYMPPAAAASHDAWPVMVFLPGGAFVVGAGDNYDPSRLAASQQVIVVTVNYRLGALGFLAHPALRAEETDGGSGNFGLMDQQAALRWVRDNIADFDGNPRNVTLFGESAGAWSACYQMVSPAAKGLFSRVILESGSCTDRQSWVAERDAEHDGPAFAEQLGCTDPAEALACLRRLSAGTITRAKGTRWGIEGARSWGPVWGDAVVPVNPVDAFASGRYAMVPAIVGTNRDEGRLFAFGVGSAASYADKLHEDDGLLAGRIMGAYPIADFPSAKLAYAASVTDSRFSCPAEDLRRLLAARSPVYAYEFADEAAPISLPRFLTGPMAAFHASELAYVFDTEWVLADPARFTPEQAALSRRIMQDWGRFAHGEPPESNWPRTTPNSDVVLQFDPAGSRLVSNFATAHRCGFWQGFPIPEDRAGRAASQMLDQG